MKNRLVRIFYEYVSVPVKTVFREVKFLRVGEAQRVPDSVCSLKVKHTIVLDTGKEMEMAINGQLVLFTMVLLLPLLVVDDLRAIGLEGAASMKLEVSSTGIRFPSRVLPDEDEEEEE